MGCLFKLRFVDLAYWKLCCHYLTRRGGLSVLVARDEFI